MICDWLANREYLFPGESSKNVFSVRTENISDFHTKDRRIRKEIYPSTKASAAKPHTKDCTNQIPCYYVEVLREFRKRFRRKRPAPFKSGQWHFHRDDTLVHNSIGVTDYLTKIGIKIDSQPPYNPDLDPCEFWLFPKFRGCRYETTDEMKEAVTKGIDTLT